MKKEMNPGTALVPCPVVLLSVTGEKRPNIITLSWAANICSRPPSVGVGIRPNRHSHKMVKDAGDFVLNVPSTDLFEATKFCGTKSGRDHDKFKECGLTALPSTEVTSPLIAECPINLECKTTQVIGVGAHDLFIGEIVAVHMSEAVLTNDGKPDPEKMKLFTYLPITGQYWALGDKL